MWAMVTSATQIEIIMDLPTWMILKISVLRLADLMHFQHLETYLELNQYILDTSVEIVVL